MDKICSLSEYINKIKSIIMEDDFLTFNKKVKIYRGVSKTNYLHIPSIDRLIDDSDIVNTYLIFEKELINGAISKMPELFINEKYPICNLVKLQHFGMPTRLLDFTYNSLVALYFACFKDNDCDGKVSVVIENEENIGYSNSIYTNMIAELGTFDKPPYDLEYFKNIMEYENKHKHIYSVFSEEFLANSIMKAPRFFIPEYNNERIKRQQGLFLIYPNLIIHDYNNKYKVKDHLVTWEPQEKYDLVISKDKKVEIIDSLAEVGITKSFLFPEPENICSDIRNIIKSRLESKNILVKEAKLNEPEEIPIP